MSIQRIYISMNEQDMFEDEKAKRREALLELAGEYLRQPVEAITKYDADVKQSELKQLGESIKRMADADYILFSGDWRSDRRNKIEMACALAYEKQILLEDNQKIEEVIS